MRPAPAAESHAASAVLPPPTPPLKLLRQASIDVPEPEPVSSSGEEPTEEDIAALMSEMSRRPEVSSADSGSGLGSIYPEDRMGFLLSAAAAVEASDAQNHTLTIPLPPSPVPAALASQDVMEAEPSSGTGEAVAETISCVSSSPEVTESDGVSSSADRDGDGEKEIDEGRGVKPEESVDSAVVESV